MDRNENQAPEIDPLADQVRTQVRAAARRLLVTDKPYDTPAPPSRDDEARDS